MLSHVIDGVIEMELYFRAETIKIQFVIYHNNLYYFCQIPAFAIFFELIF